MAALLFSLFLGAVAVMQGGLNRMMATRMPLSYAVLINSLLFFAVAIAYWFFSARHTESSIKPEWWYILPGILGAIFVFGIPWAIPQIGALKVFLCIVVGQMVMSIVWDKIIENKTPDLQSLLGTGITVVGVIVASWRKI